ncbi:WUSCHEL-related homeobox 11-like [Phragmites australis]|uniref:WUSCHEL-related homeobox 11-like n=1 Tax=Phragmites australis TaxID=29695 RepID=UPI002D78E730|nr:WUSCHEL-related homeobox 11-like [Phragmites australis]
MEGGLSPERHAAAEPVRSRWTPKPEQILILESIFNSGMVNPPKDETVRIRKLLERFGAVGDANVFYWFQNRRSRSRRRQRQLQAQAAAAAASAASSSSSGSPPGSGAGLAPGHHAGSAASSLGLLAHGAAYGSSASASWPSSPSSAGMMGDMDCGGGDDLFAISRQMGYVHGGGSGSSSSAAVAQQQQQLYYSCQPASITVLINGVATEVPRGPIDLRSMFGQDVMLVHSTGGLLPVNEYGILMQSLQMGESYFLVTRG